MWRAIGTKAIAERRRLTIAPLSVALMSRATAARWIACAVALAIAVACGGDDFASGGTGAGDAAPDRESDGAGATTMGGSGGEAMGGTSGTGGTQPEDASADGNAGQGGDDGGAGAGPDASDGGAGADGGSGAAGTGGVSGSAGAAGASGSSGVGGSSGTAGSAGMAGEGGSSGAAGVGGAAGSAGTAGMGGAAGSAGAAGDGGTVWPPACSGTATGAYPDSSPFCSDGTTALSCPNDGEDGSLHDPPAALMNDTTTGLVTDSLTGLVWEQHTNANLLPWSVADSRCKNLTKGGFVDWRLPTLRELVSLYDYGRDPVLPAMFSAQGGASAYWTRDSPAGASNRAWTANANVGTVTTFLKAAVVNVHSRCVRNAYPPAVSDAGTSLCDASTGLEWQKEVAGPLGWAAALDHCNSIGDGARLPTVKELLSLFDSGRAPHVPPALASDPVAEYWSSTPVRTDTMSAWRVHFNAEPLGKTAAAQSLLFRTFFVRCVRAY